MKQGATESASGAGVDQRREAGLRTRARLMDATLDLVAARGEDAVTLRDVTDAAGANVAAVSYHFGSLQSLRDAAVEQALETYLDAQQEAVGGLDPQSSLEDLAAAFGRPMMSALARGGRELDVMRTVARAGVDPPRGWDRLGPRFVQIRIDMLAVLKGRVSGVGDRELLFRIRCVAGMLNWLALAPVGDEIRGKSLKRIERLLVPTLVGALRGACDD